MLDSRMENLLICRAALLVQSLKDAEHTREELESLKQQLRELNWGTEQTHKVRDRLQVNINDRIETLRFMRHSIVRNRNRLEAVLEEIMNNRSNREQETSRKADGEANAVYDSDFDDYNISRHYSNLKIDITTPTPNETK